MTQRWEMKVATWAPLLGTWPCEGPLVYSQASGSLCLDMLTAPGLHCTAVCTEPVVCSARGIRNISPCKRPPMRETSGWIGCWYLYIRSWIYTWDAAEEHRKMKKQLKLTAVTNLRFTKFTRFLLKPAQGYMVWVKGSYTSKQHACTTWFLPSWAVYVALHKTKLYYKEANVETQESYSS